MTAIGVLALWYVNGQAHPTQPDDSGAVSILRFEHALRLPSDVRRELFRLLWQDPDHPLDVDKDRQIEDQSNGCTDRRPKPDPEAIYEAIQSYSRGERVFRAGTRLRGDNEEVRAAFGQWMLAELPDNEKGTIRGGALFGQSIAEPGPAPKPDPVAQPPTGRFRAVRSWTLADPDLAQSRGRINAGEIVDADDKVFRRYPHLFVAVIEERWR